MKKIIFLFVLIVPVMIYGQKPATLIKAGGGYAVDFPGLNGYSAFAEVSKPLSNKLEAGIGVKHSNLSGFPRTKEVNEYTNATSIDFNLYFLAVSNEVNVIRLGAGYSFSFYKIRRSYPVMSQDGTQIITTWPATDSEGRISGISLTGEYEYFIPGTNLSLGARTSAFKAYDYVIFGGAFVGIRI